MKKSFLNFAALLFILQNCSNNPVATSDTLLDANHSILPCIIGNTWKTIDKYYDTNNVIISIETTYAYIDKDTTMYGNKWFSLLAIGSDYCERDAFIKNNGTSLAKYSRNANNAAHEAVIIKYPIDTSDYYPIEYIVTDSIQSIERYYYHCFDLDTVLNVSGKSYRCLAYESLDSTKTIVTSVSYWCPGIGMIKKIQFLWSNYSKIDYTSELINIDPLPQHLLQKTKLY